MTSANNTISTEMLARLMLTDAEEIASWRAKADQQAVLPSGGQEDEFPLLEPVNWPVDVDAVYTKRYRFCDALAIEIARQLSDDTSVSEGPPMLAALDIVAYTDAVQSYFEFEAANRPPIKPLTDFWIAVASARHTFEGDSRPFPVSAFGPGEYWSNIHVVGSFDQVMRGIKLWMTRETNKNKSAPPYIDHDADPARISMANVSSATRRLIARANDLGIEVVRNEFATI